jgi:hypothetical protein
MEDELFAGRIQESPISKPENPCHRLNPITKATTDTD